MNPLYELRGVAKSFGSGAAQVHAVRDVDLTIEEGEFVALVGPSGSGKTTPLQLLGALDRPTRGEVCFEGRDLGELRDAELTRIRLSEIGFVFQTFNLIPDSDGRAERRGRARASRAPGLGAACSRPLAARARRARTARRAPAVAATKA
jgi:predicted ABC-type transport system involved in lysophospholipase L1 biosynthesis ATPase subunit